MLSLISRPKEIVHSLGRATGGRPIGTWVADNTQTLYPRLTVRCVLESMFEVQCQLQEMGSVQIGMCVHHGRYYEIGGGLYGRDAFLVEHLAEEHAGAGDILITQEALQGIDDREGLEVGISPSLPSSLQNQVYSLTKAPRCSDLEGDPSPYPFPFTEDFFQELLRFRQEGMTSQSGRQIYDRYLHDKVVVFVVRQRLVAEEEEEAAVILDNLVVDAAMSKMVRKSIDSDQGMLSGAGIAILLFDDANTAVEWSRELRASCETSDIRIKVGIHSGELLVFSDHAGLRSVAGDPINIASKLSEDRGEVGQIAVTRRTAERLKHPPGGGPFEIEVSNVTIKGYRF